MARNELSPSAQNPPGTVKAQKGTPGNAAGSAAAQAGSCCLGLLVPQIPLEGEAPAFGLVGNPLAVAAELMVVVIHCPIWTPQKRSPSPVGTHVPFLQP